MADRPKLEIVNYGSTDQVFLFVDGKEVTCAWNEANADGRSRVQAVADTARAVARALGADVVDADEPTRQLHTYFIGFASLRTGWRAALTDVGQIHGGRWFKIDHEIDGPRDTQAIADEIAKGFPYPVVITITGITYIDGPC